MTKLAARARLACTFSSLSACKRSWGLFRKQPTDQEAASPLAQPHLRLATCPWRPYFYLDRRSAARSARNILVAANRTSADFIISSPLFQETYPRQIPYFPPRL